MADLPTTARAMVQTGVRQLELQSFPIPEIGENDGLLRLEACGICGSDYEQFNGEFASRYPVIPGHEPVGRIAALGDRARQRWGVEEGDLVVVEPAVRCGVCHGCRAGERCFDRAAGYGYTLTDRAPALWGGYAEYMYLTPTVTMHKMPNDMPPRLAALYNPLGAGFDWAVTTPQLQVGQNIAILGPGQRGLCSVVAARAAGAGQIIVTGLARDEHKLALAREFGADITIDVDAQPTVERVLEATDGRGVDVVLDVTAYATQPVADALKMVKRGGTVVLAGLKGSHRLPDFNPDDIILHQITVKGVLGVNYHSFRRAIDLINSGNVPLHQMHTHAFPLEQAEQAIATLAGDTAAPAINVTIEPWLNP